MDFNLRLRAIFPSFSVVLSNGIDGIVRFAHSHIASAFFLGAVRRYSTDG